MVNKNSKSILSRIQNAHYSWRIYLSFLLVGISMIFNVGQWLVFIALIPLIASLKYVNKSTVSQNIRHFYIGGLILCGLANLFLLQIAPGNWTVILSGWFGVASRVMAWLLITTFCAVSYAFLGFALTKVKRFDIQLIILPILFPLIELLRSYLFALMAYGPHGQIEPNFNWGSVAVPASGTSLVYSSRLIGFFGLSFIVVVINICIYLVASRKNIKYAIASLLLVIIVTFMGWNMGNSKKSKSISASIIHLNEKDDISTVIENIIPPEGTDVLVLPEYSAILDYSNKEEIYSKLSDYGLAITTVSKGSSPNATNQMIYINKKGEIISEQDKTFLIPTGEYIPYSLQIGFRLIGKSQILQDFAYTQKLIPGKYKEEPVNLDSDINVGALACSGVGSLSDYRKLSSGGADILINSASLSFLDSNSVYHTYAKNMARFQAVVNNKPFMQASRSGQSYILNNQGEIVVSSNRQNNQILSTDLNLN